jgi:hypothetical protein
MQDSGRSQGGTRPRRCFPKEGQYAPLLARQDLVAVRSTLYDDVSQHGQRHRKRFSMHRSSPAFGLRSALTRVCYRSHPTRPTCGVHIRDGRLHPRV